MKESQSIEEPVISKYMLKQRVTGYERGNRGQTIMFLKPNGVGGV
jgi:hypothetical protein